MQNYMGIKLLQAKPMTRGDYNIYRGWTIPANENPADDGYLVKGSSTYETWSPKDAFEMAYLPLDNDTSITPAVVNGFIANVSASQVDGKTCLVKAQSLTGFMQYETSSCVVPENYDERIGTEVAMKEIKKQLWFALGFVLQWARFGLKHAQPIKEGA